MAEDPGTPTSSPQSPASPAAAAFLAVLQHASGTMEIQMTGLTDEIARRRARGTEGASIAWAIGHLCSYRTMALRACGVEAEDRWSDRFAYDKPATDGADYPPVAELYADFARLSEQLAERLATMTTEQLVGPDSNGAAGKLGFYLFHDAYHLGTIGMLRVQFGQRRTHEIALERMQQKRAEAAKNADGNGG